MKYQALLESLTRLRQLPREVATVEFKSNLDDPTEIGQYLSALANAAALSGDERAWLVWGVDNSTHAVKGTNFDPFTLKAGKRSTDGHGGAGGGRSIDSIHRDVCFRRWFQL